ncbi:MULTISPECIES: sensor histidine kinase [Streptomycetaceae]|uniref:histidine kinase n=1 Tax=Streptantibioticus cattleyicolor (strain ATCC 35852 / DSM 46488 / JCM 4925 / NBRC 14057 / NRRL 8057) TaxID=1003195 RepID=F8JTK7_STREN|nr:MULTISPECIES: ATP-binding protein [Streptomycetaceae]AEW95577.1 ATPase domain-containing protein [Streptantibioticus cattleyicolor NRRL 8057 = DSM 46488]MYS60127.1 ATP-binding protein [Streptomyces sp. SID5468]CCB75913.1 ATP-binding region ATPase domain protein [Streptantibioticus cattleyicolor NRRL 8057 = DSM 46488]
MSATTATRPHRARPPLGRALLTAPVTALVTAAACYLVRELAPEDGRAGATVVAVTAAVLVTVCATAAAYGLRAARHFREQADEARREAAALRDRLGGLETDAAQLAAETVPALVTKVRGGMSAGSALAEVERPGNPTFQHVLRVLGEEIARGERMRTAAMTACASAAGRVQALATSMLADLREMEMRHGEEVLGDLLALDHSTAQAGRLADSIAVLTGGRSGRRWTKPIVMESILRGAVGRISAYQRVRLHSASTAAVAGHAAEGVMHALAELMDNATNFSPPTEEVHVYVEELTTGVVVTIEDGGLAMSPEKLRRAEHAVSAERLDLTTLTGTRLGLPVVGCLARKHGLKVSFRPSSRGGTGAVVLIPRELITEVRQRERVSGTRSQAPGDSGTARPVPARRTATAATPEVPAAERTLELTAVPRPAPAPEADPAQPLPKRPRGRTLAAARAATAAAAERPKRARANDAGARFSAFRQASRDAAAASADRPKDHPGTPPHGTITPPGPDSAEHGAP